MWELHRHCAGKIRVTGRQLGLRECVDSERGKQAPPTPAWRPKRVRVRGEADWQCDWLGTVLKAYMLHNHSIQYALDAHKLRKV